MDVPKADLSLLGQFRLSVVGKRLRFATRSAELLLAYLVLSDGQATSREKIIGALWPDLDDARARRILSTTLWRVQRTLSVAGCSIESFGDRLRIDISRFNVDVLEFKKLAESHNVGAAESRVNAAEVLRLYQGDLLEGVDAEWCEAERHHIRLLYVSTLRNLVTQLRNKGEYAEAIGLARRVVAIDPLDESMQRELILLYHLVGNRAAALGQYRRFCGVLQSELNVAPEPSTTALWQYIRSRSNGLPGIERGTSAHDLPNLLSRSAGAPMIGRDHELEQLKRGMEDALRGRGSFFVVSGEPGVGKTKLVETAVIEATLRGLDVLKGRCADLQDPPPYQAFIEAVWPRILRDKQSGTPELLQTLLARLSPSVRGSRVSVKPSGEETAIINEMLLSLLDGESAVMLLIDDFHRSDRATEALVHFLQARLPHRRLMMVLAASAGGASSTHDAERFIAGDVSEIRLSPLARPETEELVRTILRSGSVAPHVLASIWERTSGNPLAVTEYVNFLVEGDYLARTGYGQWSWKNVSSDMVPLHLPQRIQGLLRKKIASLDANARNLLFATAVLGCEANGELLERLSGFENDQFAETVGRLVTGDLLQETARGYRFPHESHRLVALSNLTKTSRRILHRKAAQLIERAWPGKSEDLAWHFLEAGDYMKAMAYSEASGDKALSVHANGDALKWYSKALELTSSSHQGAEAGERRAPLLLKRQEVLELLGDRPRQLADLEEIIQYSTQSGNSLLLAHASCLKARILSRTNMNAEALEAAGLARRLYVEIEDLRGAAWADEMSALAFVNLRDVKRARKAFQSALKGFQRAGDRKGAARAVVGIGTLLPFTGRNDAGLAYLERAESILARSEDKRDYAGAIIQKGVFCRCLGQSSRSERLLLEGVELMRKLGDRVGEARGLSQLACTHIARGLLRKALHEALRSIELVTEAGDTRGEIVSRNNAASAVFRCLGSFDRAEKCLSKAMALVRQTGQSENQATYYDTMAAILHDKGQYQAAYEWAKESRRLFMQHSEQPDYVLIDIEYRHGACALALGQLKEARDSLTRAVTHWRRCNDHPLLAHGLSQLGLVALREGKVEEAVSHARASAQVLRRCDGVEQVQCLYWAQYEVYREAALKTASVRALGRAYDSVMRQANLLKGRLRKDFLSIPVNQKILEEHGRTIRTSPRIIPLADASSYQNAHPLGHAVGHVGDVSERRQQVLNLIRKGDSNRRVLAELLGVSERTIRNDVATLRRFGMLPLADDSGAAHGRTRLSGDPKPFPGGQ